MCGVSTSSAPRRAEQISIRQRAISIFSSSSPSATPILHAFVDFKEALEVLLARRVDLVDRKAIEAGRNYIRKHHILTGAEPVCAA